MKDGIDTNPLVPMVTRLTWLVDFAGVFDSIKTGIVPILASAFGLGLAIWGAYFVFRQIKKAGR